MNEQELITFLSLNGFKETKHEFSDSFGDFFIIYTDRKINIQISSDRSSKTIGIQPYYSTVDWYDLIYIETYITGDIELLKGNTSIETYITILIKRLDQIKILFNEKNSTKTIKEIKKLEDLRMKHLEW